VLPPANIQLLKREVIEATRRRRPRPIRTRSLFSASFARPVTKTEIMLLGNYLQDDVVYIENKYFPFFHIQGPHVFASTLSGFHWYIRTACAVDFSFS
jgi:hypothetical protein